MRIADSLIGKNVRIHPGRGAAARASVPRRRQLGDRHRMKILVTGGCGFIGSAFIRHVLESRPGVSVVNLDKLTYAGQSGESRRRRATLRATASSAATSAIPTSSPSRWRAATPSSTSRPRRTSTGRSWATRRSSRPTCAASSCCSRRRSAAACGSSSRSRPTRSTARSPTGSFTEESPLNPRNPYAASKAGGDRLAYSYWASYGVPVIITRASNNYGPYQYPEKLIPLFVTNAHRRPAPAALRRREERPRLALRARPRGRRRFPARRRASRARSTTSPAATRPRTSRSRGGC